MCKTRQPAGSGGAEDACLFPIPERKLSCKPCQTTPGGQPARFPFSSTRDNLQERLTPKPVLEGWAKRAPWECCLWVSFLPHSSCSREDSRRAGTVLDAGPDDDSSDTTTDPAGGSSTVLKTQVPSLPPGLGRGHVRYRSPAGSRWGGW